MHLVGNGVVAEFARERLAARETLEAEPDAARHAEALDGFVGVIGAGRMEAAITGEEKGQVGLVETDREERGFYGG